MTTEIGQADIFISHAHEDKEVARPLAEALRQRGLTVWYDEYVLHLGDSLRETIERGLATVRFGVVILSPNFFAKQWPQRELNALLARETANGTKVLLPVWHNLTVAEIVTNSPILADRLAVSTNRGLPFVVEQILQVLEHEKPPGLPRVLPQSRPPESAARQLPSPVKESIHKADGPVLVGFWRKQIWRRLRDFAPFKLGLAVITAAVVAGTIGLVVFFFHIRANRNPVSPKPSDTHGTVRTGQTPAKPPKINPAPGPTTSQVVPQLPKGTQQPPSNPSKIIHGPTSQPPNPNHPETPAVPQCAHRIERATKKVKGIRYVRIPSGTFSMGTKDNPKVDKSEVPRHLVKVDEFWMGETEITNKQYRQYCKHHVGKDDLPALRVDWEDADAACRALKGRLPTEAEWEYAARATTDLDCDDKWSFGNDESKLKEYARYMLNGDNHAWPVRKLKPNPWGLYDMYGNAQEWVADWYSESYPTPELQENPLNCVKSKIHEGHVLRGGAYTVDFPAELTRSAYRNVGRPGKTWGHFGFRCVVSVVPVDQEPPRRRCAEESGQAPPARQCPEDVQAQGHNSQTQPH